MLIPVFERLCKRLQRTPRGCLEWQGATDKDGYGRICRGSRDEGMEGTHRVAWVAAFGAIPDGKHVLHTCDNPPCCEPTHLWLGTNADNNADMAAKGRHGRQRGRIRFC